MQEFKNIRYYILCLLAAFGFYSYASFSGMRVFGDDNQNKDGHTINSTGNGHGGGGYFYHK
jgi:hypothetical protein